MFNFLIDHSGSQPFNSTVFARAVSCNDRKRVWAPNNNYRVTLGGVITLLLGKISPSNLHRGVLLPNLHQMVDFVEWTKLKIF